MALVVSHFTTEWGMYTFQIQIPDFMAQILQFDIATVSEESYCVHISKLKYMNWHIVCDDLSHFTK